MPDSKVDITRNVPPGFQYTQSNLQDFLDCPRRFYWKYVEGQSWPSPVTVPQQEFERRMRNGQLVHQIIERHQSGVPLNDIRQHVQLDDDELQTMVSRYEAVLPTLQRFEPRYVEILLSTVVKTYPVIAKFDFVGLDNRRLVAIDWKTGPLPPIDRLRKRMQTVVYLLVMFRAGAAVMGTDDIREYVLRYHSLATGEQHTFTVNADSATQFAATLLDVIEQTQTSDFAKVESTLPCRFCVYRGLCGRGIAAPITEMDATIWDDIEDLLNSSDDEGAVEF